MTLAAIILAAGESTRMGRPKALLPWGGTTLIDWQVRQMSLADVDDVVVVLGHEAEVTGPAVTERCRVVVNEAYQEGRASSLRLGAATLTDATEAILVLGVDQPRPDWISARLIDTWRRTAAAIVVPSFEGRRGHPVLVDASLVGELRSVRDDTLGLRAVLDRHEQRTVLVPIDSLAVNVDLNTLAEYESALADFTAGRWDED